MKGSLITRMEQKNLTIDLISGNTGIDPSWLSGTIEPLLKGRIELVIVDPGYMKVLNMRYRHINRSTDVLAFDLRDEFSGEYPEGVIYVDGRLYPPLEDLLERIYHGYLHLKGYRHETEEASASMKKLVAEMVRETVEASQ